MMHWIILTMTSKIEMMSAGMMNSLLLFFIARMTKTYATTLQTHQIAAQIPFPGHNINHTKIISIIITNSRISPNKCPDDIENPEDDETKCEGFNPCVYIHAKTEFLKSRNFRERHVEL